MNMFSLTRIGRSWKSVFIRMESFSGEYSMVGGLLTPEERFIRKAFVCCIVHTVSVVVKCQRGKAAVGFLLIYVCSIKRNQRAAASYCRP